MYLEAAPAFLAEDKVASAVHGYISIFIYLSIYLSIDLARALDLDLSIYLSIYTSINIDSSRQPPHL